ncbi:hypothetical protein [Roseateles sp. P5_E1]
MAQNGEALQAYKIQRAVLQQTLQEEREAFFAIIAAHRRAAQGEGTGPTEQMTAGRERMMRLAGRVQHEIDLLAEKYWG